MIKYVEIMGIKQQMLKASYIITLLSGIGIFNSCTGNFINLQKYQNQNAYVEEVDSVYGKYLAGRVAHIRQDYDNAAKYYVETIKKGQEDEDILSKAYIILASKGNIEEAVQYANKARQKGDKNNLIDIINAAYSFKNNNYRLARSQIEQIKEKTYKDLITPLFNAWSYVGEENYEEALNEMKKLSTIKEMETVYNLHMGLIAEYFKRYDEAETYYDKMITNNATDVSFRALQIITNFFVRVGQKNKAEKIIAKYYGGSNMKEMLSSLSDKIKNSNEKSSPIVKTANIGVSEVFLEVALLFKTIPSGYDYAQMYIAFSQYFNEDNDIAKIAMADIYDERLMYSQANKYYDSINKNSEMYYPAQIRKANNLTNEKKYDEAAKILKNLLKKNPKNFQILFNLGDVLRMNDNQSDAIKYYQEAIDSIFYESERHWPIYYAMAVSYDRDDNWEKAEESLKKALDLSHRHPQVLNYLGYSWLKKGVNVDDAVSYILEAYEKEPDDGVIIDSLGWVYFKTGDYKNAILYLEKASELNPQNAIISDHLGDAYWFGGRKNEAVFLWKHALTQKEEQEELNTRRVKYKIKNGLKEPKILTIEKTEVKESLHSLNDIME